MIEVVNKLNQLYQEHFAASTTALVETEEELCCVCMTQRRGDCAFEPCNHAVTCLECGIVSLHLVVL